MKEIEIENFKETQKYIKGNLFFNIETMKDFVSKGIELFGFELKKEINKYKNNIEELIMYYSDPENILERHLYTTVDDISNDLKYEDYYNYKIFLMEEWFEYSSKVDVKIDKIEYLKRLEEIKDKYKKQIFIQNSIYKNIHILSKNLKDDTDYLKYEIYELGLENREDKIEYLKTNTNVEQLKELLKNFKLDQVYDSMEIEFKEKILIPLKKEILKKDVNLLNTEADNFILNKNDSSYIHSFLNNKKYKFNIKFEINSSNSNSIKKLIMFNDFSISIEKKDGTFFSPNSNESYIDCIKEFYHSYIKHNLRKNPAYMNFFNSKLEENKYEIGEFIEAANLFFKNEQLLKSNGIKPLLDFKDKNYEGIYDFIQDIEYKHNVKTFALSIFSNKYKHLYINNDDAFKYIKNLYELKVSKEDLQQNIGSKIARFKDQKEFSNALKLYYSSLNEFDKSSMLRKSYGLNCKSVYDENNLLVIKINDFEASKHIGSSSWCITTSSQYFSNYVLDNNRLQFFVYNFNEDSSNNKSLIGITLNDDGTYHAAYLKDDSVLLEYDNLFEKYHQYIIEKNPELFPNLDQNIKINLSKVKKNKIF